MTVPHDAVSEAIHVAVADWVQANADEFKWEAEHDQGPVPMSHLIHVSSRIGSTNVALEGQGRIGAYPRNKGQNEIFGIS